MPHVITSFTRKRDAQKREAATPVRHRRDGYFDEHDHWHDAAGQSPTEARPGVR